MATKAVTRTWREVELGPVVLIRGPEAVLSDRAVTQVKKLALQANPAVEITEIGAAGYQRGRLAQVASPSLFQEPRLIIIRDFEDMTDDLLEDTLNYVKNPPPDVVLVLQHNRGQRGKKALEAIKKAGYPVVECPQVKYSSDKLNLVREEVHQARRKILPEAAQALVDALGSDLRELLAATAQLIDDTTGTIDRETVDRYWGGKIEATGFSVADAAVTGKTSLALSTLRHALVTGVAPLLIVSALAAKLRGMAKVAGARGNQPESLGMAPWQVKRANQELRGWKESTLAAAIVAVAQADQGVKGGSRDAEYAVEKAVLRICQLHASNQR